MPIANKAFFASLLLTLFAAEPLWAAEEETTTDEEPGVTKGADVRVEDDKGNEKVVKELDPGEIDRAKKAEESGSPKEKSHDTYYFVGLRYRGMLIPKFMQTLFGDGGKSVYANGFGPEFTVRQNNFEYVLSPWWAGYKADNLPFKAKTDPATGWETVDANLNVLYLTSDFNWTTQISPAFGLNLGLGAGIGFVWGTINRTEAAEYQNFTPCTGPGVSSVTGGDTQGCSESYDDGQYNDDENSWANGGSKPNVFPWLALQTGLRIKPHRNVLLRIDAGWGVTGPFFGIAGNYGL